MRPLEIQNPLGQPARSSKTSDLESDFDLDVLQESITQALSDMPETKISSTSRILFSFGDTRMIEKLYGILEEHLAPEQIVLILDRLREELLSGTRSQSIQDLHTIILNTKLTKTKPTLPSWNIKNPDIVFVSENPPLWGDDDKSFVEMLKNQGFSSKLCAWTSVIRYWPEKSVKITDEEKERWNDFLFSELRIWRPKLIIPIGSYATSIFLGEELKFGDRQGNLYWVGPWSLLPLYSYSYSIRANKIDLFKQGLEQAYKFCFGDI